MPTANFAHYSRHALFAHASICVDTPPYFATFLLKRKQLCDFMHASPDKKAHPKWRILFLRKEFAPGRKIFPQSVDPLRRQAKMEELFLSIELLFAIRQGVLTCCDIVCYNVAFYIKIF